MFKTLNTFLLSALVSLLTLICVITYAQSITYGLSGSAGTPSLSSCGTSPTLSSGSADFGGQITIGTGIVTSCVLTFSAPMTNQPKCVISSNSTAVTTGITALSINGFTVGASLSLPSGIINYLCIVN